MGHYSQLTVDRLYFSWKSVIPAFLTFLFERDEFFRTADPENAEYLSQIGFRTTADHAISVLERNGFTLEFFAGVYEYFLSELTEDFEESAKDRIARDAGYEDGECKVEESVVEQRYEAYLASFPTLTARQQLDDFLKLLAVLLRGDFQKLPDAKPVYVTLADGKSYLVDSGSYPFATNHGDVKLLDLENLHMYMFDKPLVFPPWISKASRLFDDAYQFEYPEIISLMLVCLVLHSVPADAAVTLDLSDILDFEQGAERQQQQIRELHTELAHSLVRKVNLYNHSFQVLFRNERTIREEYIKSESRDLLSRCDAAVSASERGRLLERLIELIFTANRFFELVDKRVSTGDEEIDLVVKNGIDTPFWNAFQSPLFFIECKNWSVSVGAKEIRDFEGKLRNHARLVKVGFFVAMNGFTREAANELKRGSRESQHIVLLDRRDLGEYVDSRQEFFSWLERKTATFY